MSAGFGSGDLEKVVNSNDTAPAWWRAQTLSWALGHLDDEVFEEWLSNAQFRFQASNEGWEQLEAARLNSALSSDRQALRSIASRQGRYLLRRAHRTGEEPIIARGLDELRRFGKKDLLARAVCAVWQRGPVRVLQSVSEQAAPSSITRTNASATFALWGEAADALTEVYATELLSWCTALLNDEAALSSFRQRFGATFQVTDALRALKGLLPVATADARAEAARLILSIPADAAISQTWAGIVLDLDDEAFQSVGIERIRAKLDEKLDFLLKNALLARLAALGDRQAGFTLIERAETDVYALAYIPNQADFDEALVRRLLEILARHLTRVRTNAAEGSFGIGGVDVSRLMTHFNLLHPSVADWDTLFSYLLDGNVAAEDKSGSISRFVVDFDRMDDRLRDRARATLPAVMRTEFRHPTQSTRHPEKAWRLHVMLQQSDSEQQSTVATFLTGGSAQRCVAAQLLGDGIAPTLAPALHALMHDGSRGVRLSVAAAVGRLVSRASDDHGIWMPVVARIASDLGGDLPSALLDGLSAAPFTGHPGVLDLLTNLLQHSSFYVRSETQAFFEKVVKR